jgi:uncharacterized protein YndB with AHSA1/START domain
VKEFHVRTSWLALVMAAAVLGAPVAHGEVLERSETHFLVRTSVAIDVPPARVFRALTLEIGRWWDSAHTHFGSASNLSIEPKAGGCFCERLDGRAAEHMRVVFVEPGRTLRLVGGLGPLQELPVSGVMTWTLAETPSGSRLQLTYAVAGHRTGGLGALADAVDGVLAGQVDRLKAYVESDRGGLR